jgi:hypothetical protein
MEMDRSLTSDQSTVFKEWIKLHLKLHLKIKYIEPFERMDIYLCDYENNKSFLVRF